MPAILGGPATFPAGLPLVRPWIPRREALSDVLASVLVSGALTNGPCVRRLEQALSERLGVEHVVAVSSCTLGLALVYQALEVRGNVVLPSFTFSASAHAVHWAGAAPRWADVDGHRLALDPVAAAEVVDGSTSAISATHIYGAPCPVDELEKIADDAGVPLVFDAAHALGSVHHGAPVGGFGTAEVFSLSPTKVLVAGEGGIVATRDGALARRVRIGRDYGNPGDYDCQFPGLNARMSEFHAATALHNLDHLDEAIERRNASVQLFMTELQGTPGIRFQSVDPGDVSTYKDLTLVTDSSVTGLNIVSLRAALEAEGIDTRRYYHPPVHRQRAYSGLASQNLAVTDQLAESVISMPLWSHMDAATVTAQAHALRRILAHAEAVADRCDGMLATARP